MTGRALITGITGQNGSYLAEVAAHQLDLGEQLAKLAHPRFCWPPVRRCQGLRPLPDSELPRVVRHVRRVPEEVYNLAAISYVPMSWQLAELTGTWSMPARFWSTSPSLPRWWPRWCGWPRDPRPPGRHRRRRRSSPCGDRG